MPMSLKCMIDKWLHKGQISQTEYDAVMKKLDGHDKQVRAEVIKKVKKSVKNALNSYNPSYIDIYNVISELSDVVIGRIEIFEEQLKEQKND